MEKLVLENDYFQVEIAMKTISKVSLLEHFTSVTPFINKQRIESESLFNKDVFSLCVDRYHT